MRKYKVHVEVENGSTIDEIVEGKSRDQVYRAVLYQLGFPIRGVIVQVTAA